MLDKPADTEMSKKRVCMIVYTIYPTDARVRREAETLASSGAFDVTVFCLKENKTPKAYSKENVNIRELNAGKYGGGSRFRYLLSHLGFLGKAFFACTALFFRRGMDIVHVHNMPNFLVFAAIVPKLFGIPLILDMHDSVPDTFQAKFSGKAGLLFKILCLEEKLSAWMSDRIICVNHVQKEVTVARGIPSEKMYISMNVPDHKKFAKSADHIRLKKTRNGKFKVVYHGTITERLGIDLAVEASARLRSRIPGLELHLWGRGDYLSVLQDRSRQLESEDRVFFHGMVPVEELPVVLAEMDLGLIPNRKSAATDLMLPVKLMEYIALGIPAVAPRLRAIEYYFTDDMVSFFEPENVDAIVEAILKIYKNGSRGKSQSENAKKFLEQYGWEKQSLDFINFYLEI
jgi:glycosyltransferase involved in cell wall biosynthesis